MLALIFECSRAWIQSSVLDGPWTLRILSTAGCVVSPPKCQVTKSEMLPTSTMYKLRGTFSFCREDGVPLLILTGLELVSGWRSCPLGVSSVLKEGMTCRNFCMEMESMWFSVFSVEWVETLMLHRAQALEDAEHLRVARHSSEEVPGGKFPNFPLGLRLRVGKAGKSESQQAQSVVGL